MKNIDLEVPYRLGLELTDNISPTSTGIEQHYSSSSINGLNSCLGPGANELKEVGW